VNATPVALVSRMLPKAMACTLTAVLQPAGMSLSRRWTLARSLSQESNTAAIAPQSCSVTLCGKGRPSSSSATLALFRE